MNQIPVRRNAALLAASMALQSAAQQLNAAMSSLTFALVTGASRLLGAGPALTMVAAALVAPPAGRLMDRVGRVPILAGGFGAGAIGALLLALGARWQSSILALGGFVLFGVASAMGSLTRAAASDMYAPAHRARGISVVMFGAVFGAILGPTVFAPIFRGRTVEAGALVVPWIVAAVSMIGAAVCVLSVRPDPRRIAEMIEQSLGLKPVTAAESAPLAEILRRRGVGPAMLASVVSFAVMATVMNLTGFVIVQHHHHAQHLVFPVIGAHVLGMFLLMPVVGAIVDRVGRRETLVAGLALLGLSTAGLAWVDSVPGIGVLLFGLGLGWNASFVAGTTQLTDLTRSSERGKLLGFNDLVAGVTAAVLVIAAGAGLGGLGVKTISLGIGAIAVLPIPLILATHPRRLIEASA